MKAFRGERNFTKAVGILEDAIEYFVYDGLEPEPDGHKDAMSTTRFNLGMVWYGMKKFNKAVNMLQDVHQEQLTRLGENHPDLRATRDALDAIVAEKHKNAGLKVKEL